MWKSFVTYASFDYVYKLIEYFSVLLICSEHCQWAASLTMTSDWSQSQGLLLTVHIVLLGQCLHASKSKIFSLKLQFQLWKYYLSSSLVRGHSISIIMSSFTLNASKALLRERAKKMFRGRSSDVSVSSR